MLMFAVPEMSAISVLVLTENANGKEEAHRDGNGPSDSGHERCAVCI